MSLHRVGAALGVCVVSLALSSTAQAQWGYGGGLGFGGGFGMVNGAYTLDPPPYFSLFPPVYYSHITPRPYGYSPYAYPGFFATPERIRMPSTPFVPAARRQGAQRPASAQTVQSVIIKNPFVLPEGDRPERLADGRPLPQTLSQKALAAASLAK